MLVDEKTKFSFFSWLQEKKGKFKTYVASLCMKCERAFHLKGRTQEVALTNISVYTAGPCGH